MTTYTKPPINEAEARNREHIERHRLQAENVYGVAVNPSNANIEFCECCGYRTVKVSSVGCLLCWAKARAGLGAWA